jgi:hypothetical protein
MTKCLFPYGPVGRPGEGGPSTGNVDNSLKEGSGYRASLSFYGNSVRGTWRGGSYFARGPERYERKALGTGISLYGGSVGHTGEGSSTRDFEIRLKGTLEVERLYLWELCEGNLEGGFLCWGP